MEPVMKASLLRFLRDDCGATALEYSLMAAIMGVVALTALTKLGTNLSNKFSSMANAVS